MIKKVLLVGLLGLCASVTTNKETDFQREAVLEPTDGFTKGYTQQNANEVADNPRPDNLPAGTILGKGCTTAFALDEDCDGYGVGEGYVLGPDADDNDPAVNTPDSVLTKYGTIQNFLKTAKGYKANNIYYMAVEGNDRGSGTIGAPFKTWAKMLSKLKPGDVGILREGIYQLDSPSSISRLIGSEGNEMVAMAYPGEKVVLDTINVAISFRSSYCYVVDGFIITNTRNPAFGWGVSLGMSHDGVFKNCEVRNFAYPTGMQDMHNLLIENNIFHDMKEHGLYLGARNLPNSDLTIRKNLFYHNGVEEKYPGFQHNGRITNLVFEDNIIHSNGQKGISLLMGVCDSIFKNNLIFNNNGGIIFWIYPGACYKGKNQGICPYTQSNNLFYHNTIWVGLYNQDGIIGIDGEPRLNPAIQFSIADGLPVEKHSMNGNTFAGNIIYTTEGASLNLGYWGKTTTVKENFIYRQGGDAKIIQSTDGAFSFHGIESYSPLINGNKFGEPGFEDVSFDYSTDAEKFDFHLVSDSPAIGYGYYSQSTKKMKQHSNSGPSGVITSTAH